MKRGQQSGFALLVVIWGLGVISLLVVSFMTTSRLRLQAANGVAGAARASAIVEGATNLAIMRLLREREQRLTPQGGIQQLPDITAAAAAPAYDGAPNICVFADAVVMVSIEDETGKIDLNASAPDLISGLLVGLGENKARADAVAAAIVAFRSAPAPGGAAPPSSGGRPFGPKLGLFQSVMELDQIEGVDPALFRRIAPLFTVHARAAALNPRAAPPALFAAMAGMAPEEVNALIDRPFPNSLNRADPRFPSKFSGQIEPGAYAIRVEAILANGQAGGRETIIDFSGVDINSGAAGVQGGFSLKEIRRAPSRYTAALQSAALAGGLRPC